MTHPDGPARGVLAEVVSTADLPLRVHAEPELPGGYFEGGLPDDPDRAFVVEAVHEGWLMHYDSPRAFTRMDADLRLLGGDALFALGLARLAARGDLEAVAELADLISLCARAVAEGRQEWAHELWRASVEALAAGPEGAPGGGANAAYVRLVT
ncbi:MAG TPA: hypothetical protein VGV57_10390 [Thermoleophilaceae bacterium]|nr:hypothetical protein [Thermoleophilaceae bacterium]